MWPVVFILIMLHGPDGREIDIAVDEITALQCRIPGGKNQLFVEGVNAVIGMTDGKNVSVVESCEMIRDKITEAMK